MIRALRQTWLAVQTIAAADGDVGCDAVHSGIIFRLFEGTSYLHQTRFLRAGCVTSQVLSTVPL